MADKNKKPDESSANNNNNEEEEVLFSWVPKHGLWDQISANVRRQMARVKKSTVALLTSSLLLLQMALEMLTLWELVHSKLEQLIQAIRRLLKY